MLPTFSYVRPSSLKEALAQATLDGARLHAGGTDLLGCLRDGVFGAASLVSLSGLDELRGIKESGDGGLRVGALTSISLLAESPLVRGRAAALAEAASVVASPQLRNQGTLGGNLCQKPRCWYYRGDFHCARKGGELCYAYGGENQFHCIFGGDGCYIVHPSDTAPALVALQAIAHVSGPGGGRAVPLERFFVLPSVDRTRETVLERGEILTEVVIPAAAAGLRSSYRKVRARASWDFALAGVALALRMHGKRVEEARVVLSGAAPVPWRSVRAEEVLLGARLDEGTITRAAAAAVAKAEPLEGNAYKVALFRGLVAEQLSALTAQR